MRRFIPIPRVAMLVTTIAIAMGMLSCSGSNDTGRSATSLDTIVPKDAITGTFSPDEARDVLAEAGIADIDLSCAETRVDPATPLDKGEVDRLQQECAAVRSFAESLSDNLGPITEDQRACLVERLVALPPEAITRFYTDALRPDVTSNGQPSQLTTIIEDCNIVSN